jgi:hypothetical protein
MSLSFNLLQSNGYFRKWEIAFDGYFAFGRITSFGDLRKTKPPQRHGTLAAVSRCCPHMV